MEEIKVNELLEGCKCGDDASIAMFFEQYKNLVYYAIHKWTGRYSWEADTDEVADIFQEIMVYLMENNFAVCEKVRDISRLSGFIFVVAFRMTGKYFEKKWKDDDRNVEINENDSVADDDMLEAIDKKNVFNLIEQFVLTLNPIEKEVFELRFNDELEYDTIAAQLELTSSNVGVVINRLKKKLKEYIKKNHGA